MMGEPSEPNCTEPMDMELLAAEEAPIIEKKGEEELHDPAPAETAKLGEKSPTGGQTTIDTPLAPGFISGRTLEDITWFFEVPLS
jgi:hypothetical protein